MLNDGGEILLRKSGFFLLLEDFPDQEIDALEKHHEWPKKEIEENQRINDEGSELVWDFGGDLLWQSLSEEIDDDRHDDGRKQGIDAGIQGNGPKEKVGE